MIEIKREDFRRLVKRHYPDYISHATQDHTWQGRTCHAGDWCGFESVITGKPTAGVALIFEHIHFEIV